MKRSKAGRPKKGKVGKERPMTEEERVAILRDMDKKTYEELLQRYEEKKLKRLKETKEPSRKVMIEDQVKEAGITPEEWMKMRESQRSGLYAMQQVQQRLVQKGAVKAIEDGLAQGKSKKEVIIDITERIMKRMGTAQESTFLFVKRLADEAYKKKDGKK